METNFTGAASLVPAPTPAKPAMQTKTRMIPLLFNLISFPPVSILITEFEIGIDKSTLLAD